jgi:hypothetical protein
VSTPASQLFDDFLTDALSAGKWYVDKELWYKQMVLQCVKCIQQYYGDLDGKYDGGAPPDVKYAIYHWTKHLSQLYEPEKRLEEEVQLHVTEYLSRSLEVVVWETSQKLAILNFELSIHWIVDILKWAQVHMHI